MVRTYMRKSNRAQYSRSTMLQALSAIRNGEMSRKRASAAYSIPRTTLIKNLKRPDSHIPHSLGRFKPVFNQDLENELVMHVVEMQQRFYGFSLMELRSLAYELAHRNDIRHPFSSETKRAGKDWTTGFLRRYPELSLRRPEATSMARLSGFNRVQVSYFFNILRAELETKKFDAAHVFNIDETGITSVQAPGHILARRGSKQVGRVVSAEKGTTTTVVCCMSAAGAFVPPVFLFKRKNMNKLLMNNCPAGALGLPSPKGWMDCDLFIKYLLHFIKCVKPSKSNPVLVLLDGHQSHKSLEAVELARKHSITMITIPPHTSHRLQPLDLTFFGPLKHAYNREVDKWMLCNPAICVRDYDLCEIFTPAYNRVASVDKAVNGFRCSGILPFNPDVFEEEDFGPSTVTERPYPHPLGTGSPQNTENQETNNLDVEPVTPVSSGQASGNSHVSSIPKASRSKHVSVLDISPYPHAAASTSGSRKRKAEVSTVLTSTPNKTLLQQKRKEMEMSMAKKIRFEQRQGKSEPQEITRPKMKKVNREQTKQI